MLRTNRLPEFGQPLLREDADALGLTGAKAALAFLETRSDYRATPLQALPALAAGLGVACVHIKDEAGRLGLGSFKALGGAYAVVRLVTEAASLALGRPVAVTDWRSAEVAAVASKMTFACATDGNHGRSVAQGAQLVGAACVIFVHAGVSPARAEAIARFGATLVWVDGSYDDSVREALRVSEANGWTVVSDTSWPGYDRIPRMVMQGYTAMLDEAAEQLDQPPTHVLIQAGVGGVAAAVAAYFAQRYGADRPHLTVVEPARAACLFESAAAGRAVVIAPGEPTVMAMLECYEPSGVAWEVLARLADAFMTVDEDEAIAAMNRFARPAGDDPAIVAGESGAAGLAGLVQLTANPAMRDATGLGSQSRVLLFNTEGATDPGLYLKLVGLDPAEMA